MSNVFRLIILCLIVVAIACQPSSRPMTDTERLEIESTIKTMVNDLISAVDKHNADKILSYFLKSDDLRYCFPGSITKGWDDLSTGIHNYHSKNKGVSTRTEEFDVKVWDRRTATVAWLGFDTGVDESGKDINTRWSWSGVFILRNGEWKIVNAHESYKNLETE